MKRAGARQPRGGAAGPAAALANRGNRSRRNSRNQSRSHSPGVSSVASASSPVSANKPVAQMRAEIEELEAIVAERRRFFTELSEEGDTLLRMLGSDADDLLKKKQGEDDAGTSRDGNASATAGMSEEEEIRHLNHRNAQLLRELKTSLEAERKYGNDPKVLDKRNEVNVVRMQIKEVEAEIQTLRTVKKRRDGALKEIDRDEQIARRVRGQQREITGELRVELKALMEQLRTVEKDAVDGHGRHARLQEQAKLGVTEKEIDELKSAIAQQESEMKELAVTEAEWKERRAGAKDENQRLLAREQKECVQLEREVDRLRAQLIQKEAELRKSYNHVGRVSFTS